MTDTQHMATCITNFDRAKQGYVDHPFTDYSTFSALNNDFRLWNNKSYSQNVENIPLNFDDWIHSFSNEYEGEISTAIADRTQTDQIKTASENLRPILAQQDSPPANSTANGSSLRILPFRAKSLPAARWNEMQPLITSMYIDKDMALPEVMTVMAEQHNFNASEQMYKKRFTAWGVKKNCRKDDVYAYLHLRERAKSFGRRPQPLTVGSKVVQEHKIQRYDRQRRRCDEVDTNSMYSQDLSSESPRIKTRPRPEARDESRRTCGKRRGTQRPYRGSKNITLRPRPSVAACYDSESSYNVQLLLHSASEYFDWYYRRATVAEDSQALRSFLHDIQNIAPLLKNASPRALTLLNRTYENIEVLIQGQSLRMLIETLATLMRGVWDQHRPVKDKLLRFMAQTASKFLPTNHPLCDVYLYLFREGATKSALAPLSQLFNTVVGRYAERKSEDFFQLQLDFVKFIMDSKHLCVAEILCQQLLSASKNFLSPTHRLLRKALQRLGEVYWLQYRGAEAEAVYLEVIQLTEEAHGMPNADEEGITACRKLVGLYREQGDAAGKEKYVRLALEGAVKVFGDCDSSTISYFNGLKQVLVEQGRTGEVEELLTKYATVYQCWEQGLAKGKTLGHGSSF